MVICCFSAFSFSLNGFCFSILLNTIGIFRVVSYNWHGRYNQSELNSFDISAKSDFFSWPFRIPRRPYPLDCLQALRCLQLKDLPVIHLRCRRPCCPIQTSSMIWFWFCFIRNWPKDSIWTFRIDSKWTIICHPHFVITAALCCMVSSDRDLNVKVLFY